MMNKGILLILSALSVMVSCSRQNYTEEQAEVIRHIKAIYTRARITNITGANVLHEYDLLKDTDVIYRHSIYAEPCRAHVKRVEKALKKIQEDNIVFGKAYTIDFTYSSSSGRRTAQRIIILRDGERYILTDKANINDDCFEFLDRKYELSKESIAERMRDVSDDLTSYIRGL